VNTVEILSKAADVIDGVGLHQYNFYDPSGPAMCVVAAMFNGAGLDMAKTAIGPGESQACADVRTAIRKLERWLGGAFIIDWNDAPGRTAEQVTTALRQCAVVLAERDGIHFPEQLTLVGAS
jgi:hypothetical protein